MHELTTFTGVGTVAEHNGMPILISAGDMPTLKSFISMYFPGGAPDAASVSITVGPRIGQPAITLEPLKLDDNGPHPTT